MALAAQPPAPLTISLTISPQLAARLRAHCAREGDGVAETMVDALELHLDALDDGGFVPVAEAVALIGGAAP